MDTGKARKEPQRWNRYTYVLNNAVNAVDPDGRDTFRINRQLGGGPAVSPWNPVSHTFIATKSGTGVVQTYSWGNTPDQFTRNKWNENKPEDLAAAADAFKKGKAVKVGDSSLDPYIKQAFDALSHDGASSHPNLGIAFNCKVEAGRLVWTATIYKQEDAEQEQTSEGEPQKVQQDACGANPAACNQSNEHR